MRCRPPPTPASPSRAASRVEVVPARGGRRTRSSAAVVNRSNSRNCGTMSALEVRRTRPAAPRATISRRAPLVRRVQVGEEEADCDGLDAFIARARGLPRAPRLVERLEHFATRRRDPFRSRQPVAALHERTRLPRDVLHERVVLRTLVATDVEHVPEPARRDHAGSRTVVLEQRRSSRSSFRGRANRSPTAQ